MKKREFFAVGVASLALVASPIINNYYASAEDVVTNIDLTNHQDYEFPEELNNYVAFLFETYDTDGDLEICGYFDEDGGFIGYPEDGSGSDLEDEKDQCFCIIQEGDYYLYNDRVSDEISSIKNIRILDDLSGGKTYIFNIYYGNGYGLISGADQEHFIGSGKDLTFHATGDFENDYSKILVDGADVEEANHTDEAGSTIITLKNSYLDTLSVGTHKLTIVYQGGNLDVNFKVSENPDTATSDLPWTAFGILGFSLGMFTVLGIADRFEKRR